MLRHKRACDAANKTTKERRSFGLEEVHPGEPYGRPNSPQSPKNKQTASACLMGHIWGFVAASAALVALPCFSSRRLTTLLADRTGSASSVSGLTRPRHSLSISNARSAAAPLANRLLWAEKEKRFLQLSRSGVNRLRTGCFLSFRNDLTRGFDSLFSGHTGQYGG